MDNFNEDIEIIEDLIENGLYKGSYEINDTLLIFFSDETELLLKTIDINYESNILILDNSDIILNIDYEGNIYIKTENYEIIEIYNVIELDNTKLSEEFDILLTKNILPEQIIDVIEVERDDYIYTDIDKKESLLSSILYSLNIYDNDMLIKEISIMGDNFINMIKDSQNNLIYNNYIKDIYNYDLYHKIPNWLIPISNDLLKIYNDSEQQTENDITFIEKNYVNENLEILNKLDISKNYKEYVNNIYDNRYYPLQKQDQIDNGYYLPYTGNYLRNCINTNCTTYQNLYSIDYRKNNKNYYLNYIEDNTYTKILIGDKSKINLTGLLLLSDNININLPFNIDNNNISLYHKSNIINSVNDNTCNYTIKQKITNIIKNNKYEDITIHNIEDINIIQDLNKTYEFKLETNISDKLEFKKLLINNIPTQTDIIQNYIYPGIYNYIFNYEDIEKIFIKYNININTISLEDKKYFNKIIEDNIKKYKDLCNQYYTEKTIYTFKKNDIDIIKKIDIIKDFIYKEFNENVKIYYLNKFINKFTRDPEGLLEDNDWLYNKYNGKKILCKHNILYSKIKEDDTAYETLIDKYGTKPIGGIIYCKKCNEYLCNEEFSNFEGFDNSEKPIFREEITNEINEFDKKEITEGELELRELINLLQNTLSVNLIEYDIQEILNIYSIGYGLQLFYKRYNVYSEKFIVSLSKQHNMSKTEFIYYFNITNKILLVYLSIIIYIQSAIPPYNLKNKLKLINIDNKDYLYNIDKNINNKSIETILLTLDKISLKFSTDVKWIEINKFINNKYKDVIDSKTQLINIIKYLLQIKKFNMIYNRIIKYQDFNNIRVSYNLVEYWTTYRPLYSNKIIKEINNLIDKSIDTYKKYILKNNITTYNIENISLLQSLNKYNESLYTKLNIKNLSLLANTSYIRLYDYIHTLYGKQKYSLYMNLLINRFINTIDENKDKYIDLLDKYKWNKNDDVDFNSLRKLLDIDDYCEDNDCKISIEIFKHNYDNSNNLLLINSQAKRLYNYNLSIIFPYEKWETIENNYKLKLEDCIKNCKDKKKCIEDCSSSNILKYFDIFCFDINNKLIKKNKNIIYNSLYLEIDSIYNECDTTKKIEPNNDNFKLLLNLNQLQNKIDKIYYSKSIDYLNLNKNELLNIEKPNLIENNIVKLLENYNNINNEYTNILKKLYDLLKEYCINYKDIDNINELNEKCPEDYYNKYSFDFDSKNDCKYNEIIKEILSNINLEYINNISEITDKINNNKYISEKFIFDIIKSLSKDETITTLKYIKTNFKEIFSKLFTNLIDNKKSENISRNTELLLKYINNINYIFAKIKNYNSNTNFNSNISNFWKLSDYNILKYKDYMDKNEFKLHNNVFINTTDKYNGFYSYFLKDNKNDLYFSDLFNIIQPYLKNIDQILTINKLNILDSIDDVSFRLIKYIFTLILLEMINYIDSLILETIDEENDDEYTLIIDNDEKYKYLSLLLKDILLNLFQEFNDPLWYINNYNNLNAKLKAQNEKEKQRLINTFDQMDKDDRFLNIQLQSIGDGFWYQNAIKENEKLVNSESWANMNSDERSQGLAEILELNSINEGLENIIENNAPNINLESTLQDFNRSDTSIDEETGYDYNEDQFDEGENDDSHLIYDEEYD